MSMSNAWGYGFEDGSRYISKHGDDTTVSQYRQIGREKAAEYQNSQRRADFYEGWLHAAGLEPEKAQPVKKQKGKVKV